ncbi:MAG: hypothetical protein ACI9WO_001436 [Sphingobacteriales bacterium]|jgi:hypothetical protein
MRKLIIFIFACLCASCSDFFRQEINLTDENFKKSLIVQALCPADSPMQIFLSHTFAENSDYVLGKDLRDARVTINNKGKIIDLNFIEVLEISKESGIGVNQNNDFPSPISSQLIKFRANTDSFRAGEVYDLEIEWREIKVKGQCRIPIKPFDPEKKPDFPFKTVNRWDYSSGYGNPGVIVYPKRDLDPAYSYLTTVVLFDDKQDKYVDFVPFLSDYLIGIDRFGNLPDSAQIPFYGGFGYSSTIGVNAQYSGKFTLFSLSHEDAVFFENFHRFYFDYEFTSEPLPLSQNLTGAHGLFIGINKRTWCFTPNHSNGEINFDFRVCN